MHISDVHDYSPEPAKPVEEFLAGKRKEAIKSAIEQIIEDEYDALADYANEYISQVAAARAEKFLERVLKGDKDAAMALLGDKSGGSRCRSIGCNASQPWASLIHGKLFETDGIKLRREIVESHADLIEQERIKDLESIVEGLTQQVSKTERKLENCHARLR